MSNKIEQMNKLALVVGGMTFCADACTLFARTMRERADEVADENGLRVEDVLEQIRRFEVKAAVLMAAVEVMDADALRVAMILMDKVDRAAEDEPQVNTAMRHKIEA